VQFSKKKAQTPISFFRDLGSGGKLVLLLSFFVFFSLLVCAGLLFWAQRREEGLEISLRDLARKDSVEELTPQEAFETAELGQEAGISEDGCPQQVFEATVTGRNQEEWLFTLVGKDVEVSVQCSPDFNSSIGDRVLVRLEMCQATPFADCFSYIKQSSESGNVRDYVSYYTASYPADNVQRSGGFYSPGLADMSKDNPQLFLEGELVGVGNEGVFVQTGYGVVKLSIGRIFTQAIGEEEVVEHNLEAAQNFVGSNIVVWVSLEKDGSLSVEKFAVSR
ncbi:MAG: hypothetical protein U9M98_00885, partial [Patescibacteria group bacterium]|nr:hypothetical protein [Patescibacteria group bacterium]